MTDGRFGGKVAVVTGGASGIGRETACLLAREGASVLIVDRNAAEAETTMDLIRAESGQVDECILDLTEHIDFGVIPETAVEIFGGIDILINGAGMGANRPCLETTRELWNQVLSTNLDSCFYCSQAVAKEMRKSPAGGRIVNIASHAAFFGSTGQVAYAASKAGMLAVTRVMAIELAEYGITVNAIAPGPVTTPMSAAHPKERTTAWMNAMPIQRYSTVNDIAAAVLFFCSGDSSHITGQTLCVDGGFSAAGLMMRESRSPG